MSIADCTILELPKMTDQRGSLSFAEAGRHIPFDIRRIFYLFDVPAGQIRAAHALKICQQVIVAISGQFDVTVDDGAGKQRFHLDRADCGLYVPPLIWREISGFSNQSVCLVLASEFYDEADYLDDYPAFLAEAGARRK